MEKPGGRAGLFRKQEIEAANPAMVRCGGPRSGNLHVQLAKEKV